MSAADTLSLAAGLPERVFASGDVLLEQGAAPGPLFVLLEGTVEIRAGERVFTRTSEPGAFLGEISVLLGTPTTAAVVADGPVRVAVLDDAASSLEQRPELLGAVSRLLARRLAATTAYLADVREQYADAGGHLSTMDRVLAALVSASAPGDQEPGGSERDDVPPY